MTAVTLFVTIHLVQDLETHSLTVFLSVAATTGYIGKFIDHTGGPDSSALTGIGIVAIMNVLHGKAGAAGADEIAATTVNAAFVVLLPHRSTGNLRREVFGNADLDLVLMYLIRHYQMSGCTQIQEELIPLRILTVDRIGAALYINAHIVILGNIGAHTDTEAVIEGLFAANQHDLDVIPDAFVILILRAVMQVHIIQPRLGIEIAAAQEDDSTFLWGIGFLLLVLCEVK